MASWGVVNQCLMVNGFVVVAFLELGGDRRIGIALSGIITHITH